MTFSLFRFYINNEQIENDIEMVFDIGELQTIFVKNVDHSRLAFDSEDYLINRHKVWIMQTINKKFRGTKLGKHISDIIYENTNITNGPAGIILSYIDF